MKQNIRMVLGIALCLPVLMYGQRRTAYTEFTGGIGTINGGNDISLNNSISGIFKEIRPMAMVGAKRHFNSWFGMGAEARFGYTESLDENFGNTDRGLESFATVMQANVFFEAHLLRFGKFHRDQRYTFYLKGGGGFTAWDPTLSTTGNVPFPSGVVPQNDTYNSTNILLGVGAKFRLNYQSVLGLEFASHFVSEDNLDGFLSDFGGANDAFGGVTVYYSYLLF